MELGPQHFENLELPGKNVRSLDLIASLHGEIRKILEQELSLGNRIFAVTEDDPVPGSISVSLRYPFKQKYDQPGLEFHRGHTPHDTGQSYTFGEPPHRISSR